MQIPALIGLTLSIYVLIEPSEKASLGLLIVYILLFVAYIIGGCFKVCFFLLYSYSDVEDYGGIGVIFLIYLSIIVAMSLGLWGLIKFWQSARDTEEEENHELQIFIIDF